MKCTLLNVRDYIADPDAAHGPVILVDRLWPRGIAKAVFTPDFCLKGAAPSTRLRTWFHHDPQRFPEFAQRYRAELSTSDDPDLEQLLTLIDASEVTLVYAARDRTNNHARVLADWLDDACHSPRT